MKLFGTPSMVSRDRDGKKHVLVAVKHGGWDDLCRTKPKDYETVEKDPKPASEPWVWAYDRSELTCPACLDTVDEHVKIDAMKAFKDAEVKEGKLFKKFDGTLCIVMSCALAESTLEPVVVYSPCCGNEMWACPLDYFVGSLDVDGKTIRRFIPEAS